MKKNDCFIEEQNLMTEASLMEEDPTSEMLLDESDVPDSMKLYLADIGRISLLTAEEEMELGKRILEGGPAAMEAKAKLVQANLRLVIYFAKKYQGCGVPLEDLNAMGTEGLMSAAAKYDYTKGTRFSTYASFWIRQAINRGIADEANLIRVPVHTGETMRKIRKAKQKLTVEWGYEPSVSEIADYLMLPEKTVQEAFAAANNILSLDNTYGEDGDTSLADFIADEKADDPEEIAMRSDLQDAVRGILSRLDPKEARVLSLRYGIGGTEPMTFDAIAKLPEFNVSRERIRQIEREAFRRIRQNPKMVRTLEEYVA